MSSIYNKKEYQNLLDGGLSDLPSNNSNDANSDAQRAFVPALETSTKEVEQPYSEAPSTRNIATELEMFQERSNHAMKLVDDIVLKRFLTRLSDMNIIEPNDDVLKTDNIILFKINKMVYEKDEYATDKFISIVSAMTFTNSSICLIVDGQKDHTNFYMGIKCEDEKRQMNYIADTFKDSILGQFPGAILEDHSYTKIGEENSRQEELLHRITEASSVSSCVGIPSYKNSKGEYTNANFIQGIEKFASAMQGKKYTAVILATNVSTNEIINLRTGYENIYTELSSMANKQLAYSTNESLANALSRTKGISNSYSQNQTLGTSDSESKSHTHTEGTSNTKTKTKGYTKDNFWAKAGKLSAPLIQTGGILTATGVGAPVGTLMMLAGGAAIVGDFIAGKQNNESTSIAEGANTSDAYTTSHTHTTNTSYTEGKSHSENFSETDGVTSSIGSSKNFTISIANKHILEIQKRIDKQLDRLELSEGMGLWSTGAYFVSYDTDRATAEIGAAIFRSIMQGEQSGVEFSAINTWYPESKKNYNSLLNYIASLSHPFFEYKDAADKMQIMPTSLLNSKEVAILLGLPRKSVPGLPVVEHLSLAKEVVRLNKKVNDNGILLGCIFDQGIARHANKVHLDTKSLTQHTFITGSTGSGKSNTVYHLIKQISQQPNAPKFLIIEPTKGEYKNIFGDEHVYGTNPLKTPLLRINPFCFPNGVHVLEHIDRLIEIFNVCWPMYAAMPAVLKEAVLNSYKVCGWDLYESKSKHSENLFPTFADLQEQLSLVINNSAYSEEVKSNYQGALITRVKSLNNGIYKQIFTSNELGDSALFDENAIIDLSRIGSQETKSLIMGILIMRLNEYRANSNIEHNSDLRHITVLEEAHNILKRCSQEQSNENSNIAGKSVELISNSIAEMRTYGEGFMIVDQSPGAVDVSAIRNTNTKIIMRLPEEIDRKAAGKASGMKDNQTDEIAKLPTGVAVVYQNDWEEPVLCQVQMFDGKKVKFEFTANENSRPNEELIITEVLKFMMIGKTSQPLLDINDCTTQIKAGLPTTGLPTSVKLCVLESIQEYEETGTASIWKNEKFIEFSQIISGIFDTKQEVKKLVHKAKSFESLTENLKRIIRDKFSTIPSELELSICQSLMRDYSTSSEDCLKLYYAWVQNIRSKFP